MPIRTAIFTGLHLHTLPTSFVRWQISRLVSDFVPVHLRHWLSAVPDCLPSVTELFSGRRCSRMKQSAWSCHFHTFR